MYITLSVEISFLPKWKICWFQKKTNNNNHSDVIGFQLQQICSCETVGKGICITRMGTDTNCSGYTIIQC